MVKIKNFRNHWLFKDNEFGINNNVISTYFNNNANLKTEINDIKFYVKVDYDGVDSFGPQSYLYDLIVSYRKGNVSCWCHSRLCQIINWHRTSRRYCCRYQASIGCIKINRWSQLFILGPSL